MKLIPKAKRGLSFSQAFAQARKAGLKTFKWKGGTYGTQLKSEVNLVFQYKNPLGYIFWFFLQGIRGFIIKLCNQEVQKIRTISSPYFLMNQFTTTKI